jgi:putative PIN family toxin of toxin-antitoxin system
MRLVLDTNVLVAAFIAHGTCAELLEHCATHHALVLSEAILDEFRNVLIKKFGFTPDETRQVVGLLKSRAILVQPTRLPRPVCRDADDDVVLATAISGTCRCLVTGDKDLLELSEYQGIRIVSPGAFWEFEHNTVESLD